MDEVKRPGPPIELNVVAAPGVVDAINRLTSQISIMELPGEILLAVKDLSTAIREHAQKVHENTIALSKNTTAVNEYIDVTEGQTEAIKDQTNVLEDLTSAVESIATSLEPKSPVKATRVTMSASIDTLEETTPMPTIQLYPNQVGKVIYTFNGTIDAAPIIIGQGFAVGVTQDPPDVHQAPGQADPNIKETTVTAHFRCLQPQNIVEGDPSAPPEHGGTNPGSTWKIGTPCTATVDNPSTQEIEKIHEEFADTFEWVPIATGKATAIGMQASVE